MPQAPVVVALDQIEALPGPGTLRWHPVRYTLGVRAFGCNAYTASEAGTEVVEPHHEDPLLAHEELYFVASGRAAFTIDGKEYDAPAGTYVFVPDPASHRAAVAVEAGTTVLSFGGPPSFEPSAWEWSFRAAAARPDQARARAIIAEGLRTHPESGPLRYELACLEASEGHSDAALAVLEQACTLRPELRAAARTDVDFASLRGDPRFEALLDAGAESH
jgi:quercetin dioxygenase-like cupin family protein